MVRTRCWQKIRASLLFGALIIPVLANASASEQASTSPALSGREQTEPIRRDDTKLASRYRELARKYEQKVKYHEEMAELYRQHPLSFDGKLPYGMQMQNHCRYFADSYREKARRALRQAQLLETKK